MKEIKEMREVTVAFEAKDGQKFASAELCRKHEEQLANDVLQNLLSTCIDKRLTEGEVFSDFGGGSNDYDYVLVQPLNEDDIKKINVYIDDIVKVEKREIKRFTVEDIGKKQLIFLGYDAIDSPYERTFYNEGTLDEIVERFRDHMRLIYMEV